MHIGRPLLIAGSGYGLPGQLPASPVSADKNNINLLQFDK